jgi:hypothetical protein
MRYRFLAIMVVLAAGSLSSCQQGPAPSSAFISRSPSGQGALPALKQAQAISLQHAVLHVPR